MNRETKDSHDKGNRSRNPNPALFRRLAGALVCVLFGSLLGWGVHALWQMEATPGVDSLKEQMMHRKTRTMEQILDGLVRGNLRAVEKSAEQMKSIGIHLNWYSSSEMYQSNDQRFRQSTFDLIEAAQRRDHDAAKESALLLERSCIECHSIINFLPKPRTFDSTVPLIQLYL